MFDTDDLVMGTKQLSDSIDGGQINEYNYRNYCGRAYYTVYHNIIAHLDAKHDYSHISQTNASYTNMGVHKRLIQFLLDYINIPSHNSNRTYKALYYRLKELKKIRVMADYHLTTPVTNIQYEQAKQQLVGVLKELEKLASQ